MKYELTEEREKQLQAVIDRIDEEGKWFDEYNTSNEENIYADYCTWGWKESGLNLDNLEHETKERVDELKALIGDENALAEKLVDCSELNYEFSFYGNYDEIFSVPVGETENELSDESKQAIADLGELTDDDKEFVRIQSDYWSTRHNGYIYSSHDGRWYLGLDVDQLTDAIDELKKKNNSPRLGRIFALSVFKDTEDNKSK